MPSRTSYSKIIQEAAALQSLDPRLVEAVVIQESGGKTHAYRYEPKFWARYLAKLPQYVGSVPERVSASYGLMQMMYTTALQYGALAAPELLFVPETGLAYGCKHLASLLKWSGGNVESALAAYNGGKADNEPGHQPYLRNGQYAKAVLAIYRTLAP